MAEHAKGDELWEYPRFDYIKEAHYPTSPVKNANKRLKIEKNYNKWIETHRTMLICGHTH